MCDYIIGKGGHICNTYNTKYMDTIKYDRMRSTTSFIVWLKYDKFKSYGHDALVWRDGVKV